MTKLKNLPFVLLFAPLAAILCHGNGVSALDLVCPRKGSTDVSTKLMAKDPNGQNFVEISGLAMSSTQTGPSGEPILYGVNDGEGGKRLGVFDSGTGQRLMTLRLPLKFKDSESLAYGSCGNDLSDSTCIYIGDVGDNIARTSDGKESLRGGAPYRIYKVREPILVNFDDNDSIPEDHTSVLEYDYRHPSSPTQFADCEAIFPDHTGWGGGATGDIYLLTKWGEDEARKRGRLFIIPASAWLLQGTYSPSTLSTNGSYGGQAKVWTRADMSPDGTLIALGSYRRTWLFPRCPGVSVADALTGAAESCYGWANPDVDAWQMETFAWTPDGARNLQIAEDCDGCNPRMGWTTMDYDDPAATISCPASTEEPEEQSSAPSLRPSNVPSMAPSIVPTNGESSLYPTTTTPPPTMAPTVVASPDVTEETPPPSSVPPTEALDSTEKTVPLEESPQVSSAVSFSTTASLIAFMLVAVWLAH